MSAGSTGKFVSAGPVVIRRALAFLLVAALLGLQIVQDAAAVEPREVLSDPTLELRAREISKVLRCLVCQNQSIDDSNAGLAKDLRVLVRERLLAGDSDTMVINFVVDRYGDYVLLDPPVKPVTYVLWAGPFAIAVLVFGSLAIFAVRRGRRMKSGKTSALTEDERHQIETLLEGETP